MLQVPQATRAVGVFGTDAAPCKILKKDIPGEIEKCNSPSGHVTSRLSARR